MKEVAKKLAPSRTFPLSQDKAALKNGTLVRLEGVADCATKWDVKIAVMHYCEPAFVDYRDGQDFAVVRFYSRQQLDAFMKQLEERKMVIKGQLVSPEKINKEEETKYFETVDKRRRNMSQKLLKKKKMQ